MRYCVISDNIRFPHTFLSQHSITFAWDSVIFSRSKRVEE